MALPIFKAPLFSLIVKSRSSIWKEEDPGGEGDRVFVEEAVRSHRQERHTFFTCRHQ